MKGLETSAAPRVLAVLALVLVFAGCDGGKSGFAVNGRLVEEGKPIPVSTERLPPGTRPIQIVFHALPRDGGAAGESFYSEVNTDTGEFTVKGPSDKGIPAGKYRISVVVLSAPPGGASGRSVPPGPASGLAPNPAGVMGMSDRFKGAFSREKSRLEVEITRPSQLVIDVGKPGGLVMIADAP
jgi:hypothetical protein